MLIDKVISRIVAWRDHNAWSNNRMSKEAGVPQSTLRDMGRSTWSPSCATIRACERIIPDDWGV